MRDNRSTNSTGPSGSCSRWGIAGRGRSGTRRRSLAGWGARLERRMSKSADKKNGKKDKKAAKDSASQSGGRRKAKGEPPKGRLVALEGARGRDLQEATERLSKLLRDGDGNAGYSRWDASNTFYELRLGK